MADWGDVPGWIEAVATVLAAGFAAVAVVYAYRALRIEQRRDALRDQMDLRAQAELVTAWPVADAHAPVVALEIFNASNAAIYNVDAWLVREAIPPVDFNYPVLPPQHKELVTLDDLEVAKLGLAVSKGVAGPNAQWVAARKLIHRTRAVVAFTDSAGRRWTRDRDGILHAGDRGPADEGSAVADVDPPP